MNYDKIFKNIEPDQKFSKSEKEWLDKMFLMFLTIRQQIRIRNSEENN
jgi:hypothetical protein